MGAIVIAKIPAIGVPEQQVQQKDPQPIQLKILVLRKLITVSVKRTSTGWSGWIPDVPEVKMCQGVTQTSPFGSFSETVFMNPKGPFRGMTNN